MMMEMAKRLEEKYLPSPGPGGDHVSRVSPFSAALTCAVAMHMRETREDFIIKVVLHVTGIRYSATFE